MIRCHDDEKRTATDWWRTHADRIPPATWAHRAHYRHCTWCGSIHPCDLADALADAPPTPPPPDCLHGEHHDIASWLACRDLRTRRDPDWVGLRDRSWTEGWPHAFAAHLPGGITTRLYAIHLTDLADPDFARVASLISRHTGIEFLRDKTGRLCYTLALHAA